MIPYPIFLPSFISIIQGLFATSGSTEISQETFKGREFQKPYDLLKYPLFSLISFSRIFFFFVIKS